MEDQWVLALDRKRKECDGKSTLLSRKVRVATEKLKLLFVSRRYRFFPLNPKFLYLGKRI